MSRRFYTADFHLGMEQIIEYENRPFLDVDDMRKNLICMCNAICQKDDVIIHVGDLATWKDDKKMSDNKEKSTDLVSPIHATFINLKGNHDPNNKVFSLARSMRTSLGKSYINVSVSHYPSYDSRAFGTFTYNDIHLCGHVHGKWKHCLDVTNHVLNINVGLDVWDYRLVSEEQLINYVNYVMRLPKDEIHRVKIDQYGKSMKV